MCLSIFLPGNSGRRLPPFSRAAADAGSNTESTDITDETDDNGDNSTSALVSMTLLTYKIYSLNNYFRGKFIAVLPVSHNI